MSTTLAKLETVERKWYVLDAAGKPLGKTAVAAANILRGKHRPEFTPHVDCGEFVIIINASKAVLWIWLMKDVSDRYTYSFKGNILSGKEDSYGQMREIFKDYSESLKEKGLNVAEHCARTWIYVRDVDVNYAGIVKARRELFYDWGLQADTHYLASTGINGLTHDHRNLVSMDTYTVTGLKQSDIQYLHALENLSPTHIYGVTF